MCGIAGILQWHDSEPPAERLLRTMLASLRHRGPDQFGIYLGPRIGLGNARLSIVDLAGGQQPLANEDGTLWIVFNGEIFNHVELRAELEARGHRFATRCDTEVILHLYEDAGPACLQRFNGQFALALWDTRDRTLFLARDRVGVRPLFLTRTPGGLAFASEIKALLTVPGVNASPDPEALEQVFTFWSPQSPRSCFSGIFELPPGHFALLRDGAIDPRPFWTPQFHTPPRHAESSVDAGVEELESLLLDATRIRLRADVPISAYLSGGLDSSLVATMARRSHPRHLNTFSVSFSDPRFDESPFQRRMAQLLETEHQVVYATPAAIGRVLPEVIWHTETPLVRTAPAPFFLLSRLVRDQGHKVVLTGEGADEFFGGYDIFKETKIRRFWAAQPQSIRRPTLLRRLYPDIESLAGAGRAFLTAFFRQGLQEIHDPAYSHALRWRNGRRNARLLSPEFRATHPSPAHRPAPPVTLPPEFDSWDPLQRAQFLEIRTFLSPYLLSSQADRVAMAHSVEGRFPFLDVRVMEFANRLPSRYKIRGLREKDLLRRVAQRWLPDAIASRPKHPYRAPVLKAFIHEASPDYVADLLSPTGLAGSGIFNPAAVAQLLAKVHSGRPVGESDEMALVGVISTQVWYRQFLSHRPGIEPLGPATHVKVVREPAPASPSGRVDGTSNSHGPHLPSS